MISTFTALFDANVLFGTRLRSLILELAKTGLFRARWSEDIHAEWMAAVVEKRPDLSIADLEPTRRAMDAAVPDCLVSGYEQLMPALELPDLNDRHVLAAAIVGKASVIVTFNRNDFPPTAVDRYGIHIKHPDEFLLDIDGIHSGILVVDLCQNCSRSCLVSLSTRAPLPAHKERDLRPDHRISGDQYARRNAWRQTPGAVASAPALTFKGFQLAIMLAMSD